VSEQPERPDLLTLAGRLSPQKLDLALTHSAWVARRTDSYERLEFLGDSVLGLAISTHLYAGYPAYPEGRLAKLKAYVVSRKSCSVVAAALGLDDLVRARAPGDEAQRTELAENAVALGNILEALIGALYLEFGYGAVEPAIVEAFRERVRYATTRHVDYKSTLQEYLAALREPATARYRLMREDGPPHERSFVSQVEVRGKVYGMGSGTSIKESEQEAAREALTRFGVLDEEGVVREDSPDGDEAFGPDGDEAL